MSKIKQTEVLSAAKQSLEMMEGVYLGISQRIEELRNTLDILLRAQSSLIGQIDRAKGEIEEMKKVAA
jgi:hypothetical protein